MRILYLNRIVVRILLPLIGGATLSFAQRALTEIPNPDSEYQLRLLEPAEGFEISLFASEPMIAKPTAMAFDAKGRLFVACTPIYPHVKPGEIPSDQIVRLEDTNGDGKADKSTVFAKGLLIPTAVLANPEGVYVANSTELLFFTDRNDDGVADSRRIIYSGFGTEDTHHIIHTLRQGPAGRIYFNQSIYTHSHVETPYGYRDLQAGGVWQFRPETLELGVYSRGLVNTWGLQFDEWGQTFQTDGAGFDGIAYSFPGAAFLTNVGYEKILSSLNPGQPKFSGLEIIDGTHFPDDWQGRLVTNDFRGNRISTFKVSDSNSGFISEKLEDLVVSTHGAFRPIDLQNGPDGALYVADWYNPIIQHGEVDFRDDRRDHTHGRIWRIAAKGRPLQKPQNFSDASVPELLENLRSTNAWVRDHSKRELKFRGAKVVLPGLGDWVSALAKTEIGYEDNLREAMWISQSLDAVNQVALDSLLNSKNFKARAAALRVLEERPSSHSGIIGILEAAVMDESPRVRNEALHVLRKLGTDEAARLVVRVLDSPMDDNLDFSLWNTLRELKTAWLSAVSRDPKFFGNRLDYLLFAIRSVEDAEAIRPLETLWADGAIPEDERHAAMILLGERGSPDTLLSILEDVLKNASEKGGTISEVLNALRSSAANRGIEPSSGVDAVNKLLMHKETSVQLATAQLLGQWKRESSVSWLRSVAADEFTNADVHSAAVAALVSIGSQEARTALSDLARSAVSIKTRIAVASGYAKAEPRQAVSLITDLLESVGPNNQVAALVTPYIAKPSLPAILAEALSGRTLNTEVATVLLRRVSTASIDTSDLQTAIQNAAGIEPVNQILDAEEMKALIQFVESDGDPVRGEQIYRRQNLLCATCHAIGGSGGTLGPDFTSIGASAPVDYLIDSLVQPQKQIKEGFHVVMVTKNDGTVSAGRLASENENFITLQDAADQLVDIPKSSIASREISPISLMPPGLTQSLRKDEFADLVKFLSRLGKEGDFKVESNRYVRTFRYLDDENGDKGLEDTIRHKPFEYITTDDPLFDWLPTYSLTNGLLPLRELPSIRQVGRNEFRYLRFYLDAKSPGDAVLRFNDPDQLVLFVGGDQVETVSAETQITLRPGVNRLTLAVHASKRQSDSIRIEVLDASTGSAQVQVVYGK